MPRYFRAPQAFALSPPVRTGLCSVFRVLKVPRLCFQVLKYSNDLNETEFSFFLFGGQVFDRTGQAANPSPDWINQSMWDNIIEADSKLESFKGQSTSFHHAYTAICINMFQYVCVDVF